MRDDEHATLCDWLAEYALERAATAEEELAIAWQKEADAARWERLSGARDRVRGLRPA